jgi:hypothetical protein
MTAKKHSLGDSKYSIFAINPQKQEILVGKLKSNMLGTCFFIYEVNEKKEEEVGVVIFFLTFWYFTNRI